MVIVVLTMCNLTISSKTQQTSYMHALACVVMKGLNSARVRLLTAWFSIKNELKIQDQ